MNENKPEPPAASPAEVTRRDFLETISIGLAAAGATILAVPLIGFIITPLFRKAPEIWRAVGPVDSFRVGETVAVTYLDASPLPWAGVTAKSAAWLRRESETQFTAFSINCTHLGCPVRWMADAALFLCPCHGGVYYSDGSVAAGPPPEPLPRYEVRVREGQVEILTMPIKIA